jgi:hypothetical protein
MERVREKAGDLMQIGVSTSYILRIRPGVAQVWSVEQDLEIQSIDLDKSSPKLMSIQLNDTIKEMFDTAQPEDSFDVKVVVKYYYPSYTGLPSYEKSYPESPYVYFPKPKIPNLVVTSPINKDTSISGFSLLDYITTSSPGALSFSILTEGYNGPNFAPGIAVDSNGYVTIYTEGTNTIIVEQAASTNGEYSADTESTQLVVSAPPPSGLIAHYPFDSDGNDASTNNNNLTNNNTVTFNTVNFMRGSGAASFNGSNYFQIVNDGRFSPDNFTVACWIKPVSSAGDYQSIATCRTGYSPNLSGWMMYIHPDNNLQFWTGNGSSWSGGSENLFSGFGNLNRWVHLAFTFNKTTGSLVMYVDGTLTTTTSRSYANTTTNSLRIGAGATEQNAQFFLRNGTLLDDFRFYNKVLSASEISDIYSN